MSQHPPWNLCWAAWSFFRVSVSLEMTLFSRWSCRPWSKFSYCVVWLYVKGDTFSCDQNLKLFCTTTLTLLLFSILSTFSRKHFIWICIYFQIVETVPHVWAWHWSCRTLFKHLRRMLVGVNLCSACSSNGECWVCSVMFPDFILCLPTVTSTRQLFLRIKQAVVNRLVFHTTLLFDISCVSSLELSI